MTMRTVAIVVSYCTRCGRKEILTENEVPPAKCPGCVPKPPIRGGERGSR